MTVDALADLKARALEARKFAHVIGECSFTLLTPSRQELRQVAYEHNLRQLDGAELGLLQYYLTVRHVVAWAGVRVRHLMPDAGGADAGSPVPCSPDAVALLLDAQPEWADTLGTLLLARVKLRNDAIEEDAKNSLPTSPAPAAWASPATPSA